MSRKTNEPYRQAMNRVHLSGQIHNADVHMFYSIHVGSSGNLIKVAGEDYHVNFNGLVIVCKRRELLLSIEAAGFEAKERGNG